MNIKLQEKTEQLLDALYEKALDGLPFPHCESVPTLADSYLKKHLFKEEAIKHLIKNQIKKNGINGFITGLGGIITLPVAVPANVSSVLYVQLRMIACIAYIYGHDTSDDSVKTLIYACLTGSAFSNILKKSGIRIGNKVGINLVKKIPGTVIIAINKKMGFRFITKFGEKGIINLIKIVPVIGGVIGGGIDVASTKIIALNAIKVFSQGEKPCAQAEF